jgi:hypothetical protein
VHPVRDRLLRRKVTAAVTAAALLLRAVRMMSGAAERQRGSPFATRQSAVSVKHVLTSASGRDQKATSLSLLSLGQALVVLSIHSFPATSTSTAIATTARITNSSPAQRWRKAITEQRAYFFEKKKTTL